MSEPLPRLDAARRALVRSVPGLAERCAHHVRRRYGTAIDFEDLVQIGHLAIARAAETYDADHASGVVFDDWAFYRATEAMIDAGLKERRSQVLRRGLAAALRYASIERRATPRDPFEETPDELLEELADLAKGTVVAFLDAIHAIAPGASADLEAEVVEAADVSRARDELRACVAALPAEDQEVLRLRFSEEKDIKRIAAERGQSYWALYRRQNAVLTRLRKGLESRGVAGARVA